jgi:hypothetical protein
LSKRLKQPSGGCKIDTGTEARSLKRCYTTLGSRSAELGVRGPWSQKVDWDFGSFSDSKPSDWLQASPLASFAILRVGAGGPVRLGLDLLSVRRVNFETTSGTPWRSFRPATSRSSRNRRVCGLAQRVSACVWCLLAAGAVFFSWGGAFISFGGCRVCEVPW